MPIDIVDCRRGDSRCPKGGLYGHLETAYVHIPAVTRKTAFAGTGMTGDLGIKWGTTMSSMVQSFEDERSRAFSKN